MDFYAFLPSNANPNIYPDNKTSNYRIQLAKRMELTGHWQAALVEAHYPNTIEQVTDGENMIKITHRNGTEDVYYVRPGHYVKLDNFLFELHEALTPLETVPNDKGRSSVVELTEGSYILFHPFLTVPDATYTFSTRLAMQLGLLHSGPYPTQTELCGTNPIDLNLGVPPQLFIYLDKIDDQIVGHTRVPLLRTVPTEINERYGSMSIYHFEQPLYFDLTTKCFDTLEINIRDHTRKLVPFSSGTSMLLVHFKPVHN